MASTISSTPHNQRWSPRSIRCHHLLVLVWIISLSYQLFTLLNSSSLDDFPSLSSTSSVMNFQSFQKDHPISQLYSNNTINSNSSLITSTIIHSHDHFSEPDNIRSEHYFFVMAQSTSTQCFESVTNNTVYCCPPPYQKEARKSKLTAFLLSFFLGVLGVDRFYLGFYLMGVIKLLTIGGCGVWWLLDWILILANSVTDVRGCALRDDISAPI
ncbi:hypothetical protein C9374_012473 [Naegleria lovaniensis]|uniref:TM2 domain-containing protein n=1 Tax=Naegleria lovaniensis TaxID=51637 RepID=A0AA88H158_NAELO|nr:uncharacterized protein C9374_012473 [Naegleria lovaniensis]KAG2392221.1 hypothetical protein C9374_012473 [Naegleria lovaniensis]